MKITMEVGEIIFASGARRFSDRTAVLENLNDIACAKGDTETMNTLEHYAKEMVDEEMRASIKAQPPKIIDGNTIENDIRPETA